MHLYRAVFLFSRALLLCLACFTAAPFSAAQTTPPAQRLVEAVDIQGNRRLRDDDLLYYVQTRPGDNFEAAKLERDLRALLDLGFFDKTETRVLTEEGTRGGVNIIFYVKELPIIRDLQFDGMKSVTESEALKAFREQRVGVSKESIFDPVKGRTAIRVLKELLAAKGHPNATIDLNTEEISATSIGVTFDIKEGPRVRVAKIEFDGNQVFSDGALRSQMKLVKASGLISHFKSSDILDRRKLEYDLQFLVRNYMRSKGYLQARIGEPRVEGLGRRRTGFFLPLPFLSSVDDTLRVTVPVTEGKVYRIGSLKVEGNSIFDEKIIQAILGVQKGDVANGERIGKALQEDLKKYYGGQGFIQYEYEIEPEFKDNPTNPKEGVVDFTINITEGKQFTLRRLEFNGNTFTRDRVLRREFLLNEGDIFNQRAFEISILRLNQLGYFEPVDKDKDADYRTDEEQGLVDTTVKVSERGRQQISFNGGVSGIGGSFFGLEYSTNNLFGRGESLALQLSAGNRQRSLSFSFTEPYFRDRPITLGFSIFSQNQKFFGEGSFLSQNIDVQRGLFGNVNDQLNTDSSNLFTRNSTGISLFLSAPLSEFYRKRAFTQLSRIGLSYQLSITSVQDPEVNRSGDQTTFIPVIYRQPNIVTSRITPTFAFDSRGFAKDPNDPVSGKQISLSIGLTGLGGDVRSYAPSLSYTQYFKTRRKKSDNPESFGFRILAGTVGSIAQSNKIRNANSLAFVDGVPVFERFFLGDEFTIRGYNVRSIGPVSPIDSYATTRNISLAQNATGDVVSAGLSSEYNTIATFTGATGSNVLRFSRSFTSVGADTQLLGNFEYRIPLFGPFTLAAFADIGTAFNLRTKGDQSFSSEFLNETGFRATSGLTLTDLVIAANPTLGRAVTFDPVSGNFINVLLQRDNRLVSQEEFNAALRVGPQDPIAGLPLGFSRVFVRGEGQTNTVVRLGQSVFSKIGDYRSSMGAELRFQVPVVNVPFRIIYAYNPNARFGTIEALPGIFFNEKRSVFRFSVGRTF